MYPVILDVRGKRAVVVGGGRIAERKVRGLLEAGATVALVAPAVTGGLAELAGTGAIAWSPRRFERGDVEGAFLAIAATDDDAVNAAVVADAKRAGALVNDAGDGARGDFVTPAVHRAGPLTVTVDSGGASPALARRIRDELAVTVDARYARAAATLGAIRERVFAVVPEALRSEVLKRLAARDLDELAAMPPGAIEHEVERTADTVAGVVAGAPSTLTVATRGSALAMVQTRMVAARLARSGIASTVLEVTTRGDTVQDRSIAAIGENVFVHELERALRERRADYAVHSCKDLPSRLADDMELAAITMRDDPRDAFCSELHPSFEELPSGARVGTSSPRRRAHLAALRPDLRYEDVRGNVDTRLRKLREGEYDALVLACAGLARLELTPAYFAPFEVATLVPAVAQGALAVETRRGEALAALLRERLEDRATALAVHAERAVLRELRGGCEAPVGAHGVFEGGDLVLIASVAARDGSRVVRRERRANVADVAQAEALGVALARDLLDAGGGDLLAAAPLAGHVFLLPRTQERPSRIAPPLRDAGAEVVEASDSDQARALLGSRVPTAVLFPSSGSVGVVTAYLNALRASGARPVVAAMGPASSASANAAGWTPDVVAAEAEIGSFVQSVTRFVLENKG